MVEPTNLREALALLKEAHEAVGVEAACTLRCRPEQDPEDKLCPACLAFVALETALPWLEGFVASTGDMLSALQADVGEELRV